MTEDLDIRRKRLLFRSVRRGTKESDLVIGGFAKRYLAEFDEVQLERFEVLLECNDPDLLGWAIGLAPVPPEYDHDVMALLKDFKQTN